VSFRAIRGSCSQNKGWSGTRVKRQKARVNRQGARVGDRVKGEMAAKLKRNTVSGALSRLIRQLLKEGIIEMTLLEKPNSRLQKYRLVRK